MIDQRKPFNAALAAQGYPVEDIDGRPVKVVVIADMDDEWFGAVFCCYESAIVQTSPRFLRMAVTKD